MTARVSSVFTAALIANFWDHVSKIGHQMLMKIKGMSKEGVPEWFLLVYIWKFS